MEMRQGSVLHTDADCSTSNDDDVFCGLKALLPLSHEFPNVGVGLWEVDGTRPFGSSREHEG